MQLKGWKSQHDPRVRIVLDVMRMPHLFPHSSVKTAQKCQLPYLLRFWCFSVWFSLLVQFYLYYVHISNMSYYCAGSDQGSAERSVPKRKVSSPPHSSNGHSPSESSSSPVKKKKKPGAVNSSKDQVQFSLPIQALVQSCMSVIH